MFLLSRGPSRCWWNRVLQHGINFTTRHVYKFRGDLSIHRELEQKRLDLENVQVWSKDYLPATRTTTERDNYESKLIFWHVQISFINYQVSYEAMNSCGPLPDWLKIKSMMINTFGDNMCVWRCLAIYKHKDIKEALNFYKSSLKLSAWILWWLRELKRKDMRPTKVVDFEDIARHHNVNIMLCDPKKDKGKDAGSIWWLVYGKIQIRNNLPTVNMGLVGGYCFYIKSMDVLCK